MPPSDAVHAVLDLRLVDAINDPLNLRLQCSDSQAERPLFVIHMLDTSIEPIDLTVEFLFRHFEAGSLITILSHAATHPSV